MTAEDGAGADNLADNLADRGRQSWVDDAGVQWTRRAFEDSDAEALYCPVRNAGQWNGVMERLHSRDRTLGRRWRDTKLRPDGTGGRQGARARVLALTESGAKARTVLYAMEGDEVGTGVWAAAAYADRGGLERLAIDGSELGGEDGRAAVRRAARAHATVLVVHV